MSRKWMSWMALLLGAALLASCASGPVRRVSEPSARIQQLTVQADGSWSVQMRLENFSSIPMRFDSLRFELQMGDRPAGTLQAQPDIVVGPESADVFDVDLIPDAGAKLAVAEALAAGRSLGYTLEGSITATPDEERQRAFDDIHRNSALSPAPGLPGVMR